MEIYQPAKPTVLLLGNSSDTLSRIAGLLHGQYTVKAVTGDKSVQDVCSQEQPDLILINVTQDENEGFEACRHLKAGPFTRHIPVIFLTLEADTAFQMTLYEIGAVDFVTRPICPPTLLSRIKAQLAVAANERAERVNTEFLAYEAFRHQQQLGTLQERMLLALASLADTRASKTVNHLKRTQHYIFALGQNLQNHPRFSSYLTTERLDILFKCAPLYDIGKVGIPEKLLFKPGHFEAPEYEVMKTHPKLGRDALLSDPSLVGETSEFLAVTKEIIYSHHEKWDGTGYPQGLIGEAIPISARLMAVADVYDALISPSTYKEPVSHAKARQIIEEGRGKHFDPDVVDTFLTLGSVFQGIASRFSNVDVEQREDSGLIQQSD